NGRRLGNVGESFIARLSPGEHFIFGGEGLEVMRGENKTPAVKPRSPPPAVIPRRGRGRYPLSHQAAHGMRELLALQWEARADEPEMNVVRRLLRLQQAWSKIPRRNELLVEQTQTREGHHVFFYPFEGRSVHLGLSALLAYRIARGRAQTFTLSF